MMQITKEELINKCKSLLLKGFTKCKGDKGYEQGKSIQDYFEAESGQQISKTEVRSWFKQFSELKGLRRRTTTDVVKIIDSTENVQPTQPTEKTQEEPQQASGISAF